MSDFNEKKMRNAFYEEAGEILLELESSLLELGENPNDKENINTVFRSLHTLKGSGAMFGFYEISVFVHDIETIFELVRNDEVLVTGDLISLTLQARDQISRMLEEDKENSNEIKTVNNEITAKLKQFGIPEKCVAASIEEKKGVSNNPVESSRKTNVYRICFSPDEQSFLRGVSPLGLVLELKKLGECQVVPHFKKIPDFYELNPEFSYIYWDLFLTSSKDINTIKDVFIFCEENREIEIEIVHDSDCDIQSAMVEQNENRKIKENQRKPPKESSIRVGSGNLDKLIDMVGELVTIQTGFSQRMSKSSNLELQSFAEEIERITFELRDISMSLRMIPIGTSFNRFKRLIHDKSRQLGKKIELVTEGEETQLDATIIEQLVEPLMHLIRNSIDHGIETIEEREKRGKNPIGCIHLNATHSGGHVIIQISDDGAGLDPEQLLEKGINKGLVSSDEHLSEKEIYKLIFSPGLSTAKEITDLSGRGVGMDVVKKTIEELGGVIEIESKKGKGLLFTLRIPLTLAIIRGLMVRISSTYFIIPLTSVEEYIQTEIIDSDRVRNTAQINVRGELVPYINLRRIFLLDGETPDLGHIVLVNSGNCKTGLLVDEVIGEQQTVVKNLGEMYKKLEGISGATILGDGKVGLILDIRQLVDTTKLKRDSL